MGILDERVSKLKRNLSSAENAAHDSSIASELAFIFIKNAIEDVNLLISAYEGLLLENKILKERLAHHGIQIMTEDK